MDRSIRDILMTLVTGGGVTSGVYEIAGYLSLAGVTGLCWAVGVALALRIDHLYPAYWTGEGWADRRWRGLAGGTFALAATIGVSPLLPVTNEVRFGLGTLVVYRICYSLSGDARCVRTDGRRHGSGLVGF
ncbi:sterol desaturase [Halobacteriales archaeon QH_7_66_36]|nr:MAG: sterol desaturase [Halobacteriales archaeon QH_7_66_36]